jgi:glycosyltransferase involved in cell wall biosynthesis
MIKNTICLDENYSTTRLVTQEKPEIINKPEDKFESVLFLPEGENRKGEGGLRTKGYFKKSFDDKPLVSIITVVYNGEKYLEETIQSVINQTYDNVEYIIIDGGSTDGTIDIIKKYEDKIDYWVSEMDKGIYDAMNKGIILVNGKWINFMNAGDRIIFLDTNSFLKFNSTNTSYYYNEEEKIIKRDSFTKMYLTHNVPCHQSIFYKKDEIILFDLNYPIIADFEQMTKICAKHIFPSYSEHVVYFAKAGISYENNHDKNWKKLIEKVKIIYNNLGLIYGLLSFLHIIRIKLKEFIKK